MARLAGLPAPVIRAAGSLLSKLEARDAANPDQIDLFDTGGEPDHPDWLEQAEPDPTSEALLEQLQTLDPDRLTPREALDALYQLKQIIDSPREN